MRRNVESDWGKVWDLALEGRILDIEPSIRIQHYRTLRSIAADYCEPVGYERQCFVYWGPTGVGKSRRAWYEAGLDAYPKDPRSKFWCGYNNQEHIVIDEFRGGIDISHILRWLDRYPVIVEVKGSSVVLRARKIWITSNIPPRQWFDDVDSATYEAVERRLEIVHMVESWVPPE